MTNIQFLGRTPSAGWEEPIDDEMDSIGKRRAPSHWWRRIFLVTVIWTAACWIFYPSWLGFGYEAEAALHNSERAVAIADAATLKARRSALANAFRSASIAFVEKNPALRHFAMGEGKSIFGSNCAPCHGAWGQGVHGYPNLRDDVWLWGGKLSDIEHIITVGVLSADARAGMAQMPAFVSDGMLEAGQINDLTEYVLQLSNRPADWRAVRRASQLFSDNCSSCHGAEGGGNPGLGIPDFAKGGWRNGSDRKNIHDQIWIGHGGVMPGWGGRLKPEQIKALAIYVHNLGGGK